MLVWKDLYFQLSYMLQSVEAARDILVISFKSINEKLCSPSHGDITSLHETSDL